MKQMNKKGNVYVVILFIFFLALVLALGVMLIVGSSLMNWVFDEVTPELTSLGQIGNVNATEIGQVTINPLNTVVQQATWVPGILYVIMLIGTIAFCFIARSDSSARWTLGFFVAMLIFLLLVSILVSNIYEDFRVGDDELSTRLKEHTLLDFMIIHSPLVLLFVGVIGGIIIYSGLSREVSV